jgi:hypothetical protein
MQYLIRKLPATTATVLARDNAAWDYADLACINCFRPESSPHRPQTTVRLLYDRHGLHGRFQVRDQYVRCQRTQYGSEVWKDSCVEFFVEPKAGAGYLNFEFNCGGAFLCSHIVDPTRTPEGFKQFTNVPVEVARRVLVQSTLPAVVEPEINGPVDWQLRFFIPFVVLEQYAGPLGEVSGQRWRGNFFKCAEDNSHPHWAAWSPVDEFNFHLPRCFGTLRVE